MKRSTVVHGWIVIALLLASGSAALAVSQDDFEAYVPGAFPPAPWLDAGQVASPFSPDPSAIVFETTDALGGSTRAVSVVEAFSPSQGIYQLIPVNNRYSVMVDVRIDQFSLFSSMTTSDWAIGVGVAEMTGGTLAVNPAFVPQVSVFASSQLMRWRIYATDAVTASDIDLAPALAGRWYRVAMELDVDTGQLRSRIWDIATDQLVVDQTDPIQNFLPESPGFNAMLIYEGELSATSVPNRAVIDNVVCPEIFTDGFESGDVSSWAGAVP